MHSISRRAALGFSLTVAITGHFPNWRASAENSATDELYARFLRWSRTATGFADLPDDVAGTFMDLAIRSGIIPADLSDLGPDRYRGTAVEKRLLEAWYTGLFTSDGLPSARSYETTLMWRAAGIDPRPSTCDSGPERWASAPSNI
jgi:hypothetical protein